MKLDKTVLTIGLSCLCFLSFIAGYVVRNDQAEKDAKGYQIELKQSYSPNVKDSIQVFDGKREVGTVAITYGEPFAELLLSDNE